MLLALFIMATLTISLLFSAGSRLCPAKHNQANQILRRMLKLIAARKVTEAALNAAHIQTHGRLIIARLKLILPGCIRARFMCANAIR